MTTLSSAGSKISEINKELQKSSDISQFSHLKIIEDASKDLLDLFKDTKQYLEINNGKIDHKKDLEITKTKLEEKQKLLSNKDINDDVIDGIADNTFIFQEKGIDKAISSALVIEGKNHTDQETKKTTLETELQTIKDSIDTISNAIEIQEKAIEKLDNDRTQKINDKTDEIRDDREKAKSKGEESPFYAKYDRSINGTNYYQKYIIPNQSDIAMEALDERFATALIDEEIKNEKTIHTTEISKQERKLETAKQEKKDKIDEIKLVEKAMLDIQTKIDELNTKLTDQLQDPAEVARFQGKLNKRLTTLQEYVDITETGLEDIFNEMSTGLTSEQYIQDLATKLIVKTNIKDKKNLQTKLAFIVLSTANLHNISTLKKDGKDITKKQVEEGTKQLKDLDVLFNQLHAHQTVSSTIGKVNTRITNLSNLDTSTPNEVAKEELAKGTKKVFTITLKDHFFNTDINELPDEYVVNTISIKGSDGKDQILFADDKKTPVKLPLRKGDSQALFVEENAKMVAIGNVKVNSSTAELEINAYETLPSGLETPLSCTINVQGIGVSAKAGKQPVSTTKNLVVVADKPSFAPEYDELEDEYKINEKLSLIFDEQYESQLKERFYEVLSKDPQCIAEWAKLTDDQKNDFFQTVIAGGTPTWADGRAVPAELTRAACYTKAEYHADIKKWILEGFTGKTKAELKKYIFDKLGTLDFTELGKNPYAIKVLADSIRNKMKSKSDDAFYLLNHYALATRFAKTHVAPEELLPDGSLAGEKTLDAAVADSKELYKESAYEKAQKQLEEYYKSGARFGLKRAKVFFFRGRMIDKAIAKDLKANKGMHMDTTSNAAVNRWMLEQAMGGEFAKNIEENTTVFDDPVFQDRLNSLVEIYLKSPDTSADSTFANEVQSLIMSNTQLKHYMKEHNITHLGTNLVEQAKAEKEERTYYSQLINIINQYTTDGSLNKPQEFEVAIRKQLADFAKKQNRLPDMIKQLDLQVDDVRFAEKIANHKITLERMKMRTVKLRLRLLTNKSEDEKGLTTAQDVDRDKFAKPGKLTKWMEKHPWWTTSITAVGLVGAGIVGTLTVPVLGAGAGAGMLWYINFLKKRGHYTEEHKKFEQHILAMTPAEREKYLEDMKEKSDKMPKRLRRCFSDEYSKYGRSMEYLTQTDSVQKTMGDLDRYINKPTMLETTEKDQFATYLKDAITLLEMHKKEGRNFMHGEQGKAQVEELYNLLHQKLIAGIRRYDGNKNPDFVIGQISSMIDQHQNVSDLQDEYDKEKKDMSRMKNKLGIFSGTKSAAIYLGTARLGGLIKNEVVDGWNHIFGNHSAAATAPTPGHTTTGPQFQGLDQAFGSTPNGTPDGHLLLKNVFNNDTVKYQQLVDKLQHLPTSDHTTTLRGSLKDIFGTDQLANAKTHEIFNQFAANITDHNVQELVAQGANVNIHSAQQIAHLMSNRGYSGTNVDAGQIQSLINGFHSGTINLSHLPVGWTKETACNALFCNTQGHQLTDLFFDTFRRTVNTGGLPGTPGSGTPPLSPSAGSNFLGFGLPTFFNEIRNKK